VPDGPSAVLGGRADVFAYFNNDVKAMRSGTQRTKTLRHELVSLWTLQAPARANREIVILKAVPGIEHKHPRSRATAAE